LYVKLDFKLIVQLLNVLDGHPEEKTGDSKIGDIDCHRVDLKRSITWFGRDVQLRLQGNNLINSELWFLIF